MSEFGVIYLLHFDRPGPGGARHYMGWTQDLEGRLAAHRAGRGARLTAVVRRLGIGWTLVAITMAMTRHDERRLKRRHQLARLCPVCRPVALARHRDQEREARKRKRMVAI